MQQFCQQDSATSLEHTPVRTVSKEFNPICHLTSASISESHNIKSQSQTDLLSVENEQLKRSIRDRELEISQLKQVSKMAGNHRAIAEKLKTIESIIQINTIEPKMVD